MYIIHAYSYTYTSINIYIYVYVHTHIHNTYIYTHTYTHIHIYLRYISTYAMYPHDICITNTTIHSTISLLSFLVYPPPYSHALKHFFFFWKGRAGDAGVAVSFVTAETEAHFALIEKRHGGKVSCMGWLRLVGSLKI